MEQSSLSGSIWSNQSNNFTPEDIETNVVDSLKPAKGFSEAIDRQDELAAGQEHLLET